MATCMMSLIGSFIVVSSLLMGATQGTTYTVGDSLGWRFPPNESYYSDWATNKTFSVGDTLIFNWTGDHSMGDVTKADYDNCSTMTDVIVSNNLNEGLWKIDLPKPGSRYFICTVANHCSKGMKFSINVVGQPGSSASALSFSFTLVFPLLLSTLVYFFFGSI